MRAPLSVLAVLVIASGCGSENRSAELTADAGPTATDTRPPSVRSTNSPPEEFEGPHRCRDGQLSQLLPGGEWRDLGSCIPGSGSTPCRFIESELMPAPVLEWDGTQLGRASACLPLNPTGIAGSSDHEVWVVGGQSVYRWDGREWFEVQTLPASQLLGVFVDEHANAWVHGARYVAGGWAPLVVRWNGTKWEDLSPTSGGVLMSMHGTPGEGPWAVSSRAALRWTGTGWHATDLRDRSAVRTVFAFAPNDVWAMSSGGPDTPVSRWDGYRWEFLATLPYVFGTSPDVFALSRDNVWISGGHHWNGASWTHSAADVQSFAMLNGELLGFGGSDGCGGTPGGTTVWRWNSTDWVPTQDGLARALEPTKRWMNTMWTSGTRIWLISAPITVQC